jgi:hypothetical protein
MKTKTVLLFALIMLSIFLISNVSALTFINSCQNLNVADTYYQLNSSISNDSIITDCIIISASNITVDCNGFYISSIKNFTGISTNQPNSTIKNCNITMGGSAGNSNINAIGIQYTNGANDGKIFNNTVYSYLGYGIFINAPDRINITKNTAKSSLNVAIRSIGSDNSLFNSNIATSDSSYSLGVESSINDLIIYNNGTSLSGYGINLDTLTNANISYNNGTSGSYGIYFIDSNNANFNYNHGLSNNTRGIYSVRATSSNFISNIGNGLYGMFWNQGSNNIILNNIGIGTVSDGITISTIGNSSITSNIGTSISGSGFYAFTNVNNTFVSNIGTSNSSNGMFFQSVSNSTSSSDTGSSNYSYGSYFYSSSNIILSNPIILGNFLNAYGLVFRSSDNNLIKDCINITGIKSDILYTTTASSNNTFLNCSYRNETMLVGSSLIRKWYYKAYVNDSSGNPVVAIVNATNSSKSLEFSTISSSLGFTPTQTITDYVNLVGVKYFYSPYNITAFNSSFAINLLSHSFNASLGNNLLDYFTFTNGIMVFQNLTIQIVYPENISYNINVTSMNYTFIGNNLSLCWYSLNNGITNSTPFAVGVNFTNLSSNAGINKWIIYCNNTLGNQNYSSVSFFINLPPTIPIIYNPVSNYYHGNIDINYTASISPNNYSINFYNITLLNLNLSYNTTIIANNSNNLGYIFNISLVSEGFYIIKVTACDINNLCSNGFSSYFGIDNTAPYGNLIFPFNNSYLSNHTVNFSIDAYDNGSLHNLTLFIYNQSGSLVHNETIYTNATQGLFGIVYNFIANGLYTWFYTIYDTAGNFFQSIIRTISIISVPTAIIYYPTNNSNYTYFTSHLDYQFTNGDTCWYTKNNGITNLSLSCSGNTINTISNSGINQWTIYANNSIGNETSYSVFFNSTCANPTPIVHLNSYPYVDFNTTFPISVTSFPVGNSNIQIELIDPDSNISVFNMTYDNVSAYVSTFVFTKVGDYHFTIYGDGICPTIETNISGTLYIRVPFYVTIDGYINKSTSFFSDGKYKNDFAYVIAEITSDNKAKHFGFNDNLEIYITPLLFSKTFKSNVYHAPYSNGQATLKLYERNTTYALRLLDGQVTFPSEYSVPNITKSYGTNVYLGQMYLNGTDKQLNVLLTNQDLHPYFWLFNWILIIAVVFCVFIGLFLFFMIPQIPIISLAFMLGFPIALILIRIIIWFVIG